MNKKMKIFYIVDLIFMIISIVGIIIVDNKIAYGLEALSNVGDVVILLCIFIVSLILLIIVSLIYAILKKKQKNKML